MDKPEVQKFDLTRTVPQGISLKGLSEPRFDGVNYFRNPTALESTIGFSTHQSSLATFQYQLFSAASDVTGKVYLDGQLIGTATFPKGKFVNPFTNGSFIDPGQHSFRLVYECSQSPCQTSQFSQYWTQVTIISGNKMNPVKETGFGSRIISLDGIQSPLQASGTSGVKFDGSNFYRSLDKGTVVFSWPERFSATGLSFYIWSPEDMQISALSQGKTIFEKKIEAKKGYTPDINLMTLDAVNTLKLEVDCTPAKDCAVLYHTKLSLLPQPKSPGTSILLGLALIGVVLLMLARWLQLSWGVRKAVPG